MPFGATHVNFENLINDLMAGDPFVWGILVVVVFFTGFSAYQKYRTFSSPSEADF